MTSSRQRSVLISGASVAGPALAYWLNRYGFKTTVVERASELRLGGQNIDIRGAGREVARRMDLEDDIRAATTGEEGTRFVDEDDEVIAEFPAGTGDSDGPTAELEILRGDLGRLLYERTVGETRYVFGDHITGLEERDDDVLVSFEHAEAEAYDLVVAADGIRSSTRSLVFGDEVTVKPLGLYTSYFTIPRTADDEPWWRWFGATGGRTATLRPDNVGTTRAGLSFMSGPRGYERLDGDAQKAMLRKRFAGLGWQVPRILDALTDADVYLEAVGQVKAPHWSRGRVALLGDAAYCASPISGMGTSLALAGAYVLADALARNDDHAMAFSAYEDLMRPYVDQAQKLPPGTPGVANPRTKAGLALFHTALRVGASRIGSAAAGKLFTPPAEAITLPGPSPKRKKGSG